jgi:hypothetical protein
MIKIIFISLLIASNIYSQNYFRMAQKIKYSESKELLEKLESNQLEYNFFGLNRSSTDCIYFAFENNEYLIEFEVMLEEQKAIAEKFKEVCSNLGYNVIKTTYGNSPEYSTELNAPVYQIRIGQSKEKVYDIGLSIISQVFGNDENTVFEVVP